MAEPARTERKPPGALGGAAGTLFGLDGAAGLDGERTRRKSNFFTLGRRLPGRAVGSLRTGRRSWDGQAAEDGTVRPTEPNRSGRRRRTGQGVRSRTGQTAEPLRSDRRRRPVQDDEGDLFGSSEEGCPVRRRGLDGAAQDVLDGEPEEV